MKEDNGKRRMPVRTILIYLVLITMLLIGVTLARYVATGSGGDAGRVAADGNVTLHQGTEVTHKVVPGVDIRMDPKVSFSETEMDSYVFVRIDAPGWKCTDAGSMTFSRGQKVLLSMDADKTVFGVLEAGSGYMVLYTKVEAGASLADTAIIKGDAAKVSSSLTEDDMESSIKGMKDISMQAWDVQAGGFSSPQEAWASVSVK